MAAQEPYHPGSPSSSINTTPFSTSPASQSSFTATSPTSSRSHSLTGNSVQFPKLLVPISSGLPVGPSPRVRSADASPASASTLTSGYTYGISTTTRRPTASKRRVSAPSSASPSARAKSFPLEPHPKRKSGIGRLGQKLRGIFPAGTAAPLASSQSSPSSSKVTKKEVVPAKKKQISAPVEFTTVGLEHWTDDY